MLGRECVMVEVEGMGSSMRYAQGMHVGKGVCHGRGRGDGLEDEGCRAMISWVGEEGLHWKK